MSGIKGITLWQPWATLVAIGAKTVETRGWSVGFRGVIAIHAGKHFPPEARDVAQDTPARDDLAAHGFHAITDRQGFSHNLPLGQIVAVAVLHDVIRTDDFLRLPRFAALRTARELAYGDYTPGRYAWILRDIRRLPHPIACQGARALWDVPTALEPLLRAPEVRPCATS